MKTIEEQLWDYLDNYGNSEERAELEQKIATDSRYKETYESLLLVHEQLTKLPVEGPSMAFTRHVMEDLKSVGVPPPLPLQTKANPSVIWGVAAFFLIPVFGGFLYVLMNSDFSGFSLPEWKLPVEAFKRSEVSFAFFALDFVLGMICIDALIRKRTLTHKKRGQSPS